MWYIISDGGKTCGVFLAIIKVHSWKKLNLQISMAQCLHHSQTDPLGRRGYLERNHYANVKADNALYTPTVLLVVSSVTWSWKDQILSVFLGHEGWHVILMVTPGPNFFQLSSVNVACGFSSVTQHCLEQNPCSASGSKEDTTENKKLTENCKYLLNAVKSNKM